MRGEGQAHPDLAFRRRQVRQLHVANSLDALEFRRGADQGQHRARAVAAHARLAVGHLLVRLGDQVAVERLALRVRGLRLVQEAGGVGAVPPVHK